MNSIDPIQMMNNMLKIAFACIVLYIIASCTSLKKKEATKLVCFDIMNEISNKYRTPSNLVQGMDSIGFTYHTRKDTTTLPTHIYFLMRNNMDYNQAYMRDFRYLLDIDEVLYDLALKAKSDTINIFIIDRTNDDMLSRGFTEELKREIVYWKDKEPFKMYYIHFEKPDIYKKEWKRIKFSRYPNAPDSVAINHFFNNYGREKSLKQWIEKHKTYSPNNTGQSYMYLKIHTSKGKIRLIDFAYFLY